MYDKHIYQNKDFTVSHVKSWNWYLKLLKLELSLTQHRRFGRQNPPSSVTVKWVQHLSMITVYLESINLRIS